MTTPLTCCQTHEAVLRSLNRHIMRMLYCQQFSTEHVMRILDHEKKALDYALAQPTDAARIKELQDELTAMGAELERLVGENVEMRAKIAKVAGS